MSTNDEPVNAIETDLQQGDVIDGLPLVVVKSGPDGLLADGIETSYGLAITTQTCDLVRDVSERPYFTASPVVDLSDSPMLADAKKRASPRWAAVRGIGDAFFVDLDLSTTYEKRLLYSPDVRWTRGLPSSVDERNFAACLARSSGRFPFPDKVQLALQELRGVFRKKAGKQSPLGRAVDVLEEVRVESPAGWDHCSAGVKVHFVFRQGWLAEECHCSPHDLSLTANQTAELIDDADLPACPLLATHLAQCWIGEQDVLEVQVDVHDERDLSHAIARRSEVLDFDFLSIEV